MQHVAASNNNVPDKLNIILLMNTIIIGLVLRSKVGSTNQIWPSTIETSKELNLHPTSSNDICPANMFCLLHIKFGPPCMHWYNQEQWREWCSILIFRYIFNFQIHFIENKLIRKFIRYQLWLLHIYNASPRMINPKVCWSNLSFSLPSCFSL